MKKLFFCTILAGLVGSLSAQVVINEVSTVETGTDDAEYIELHGPASTSLNDMQVELINGSNGLAYDTIDLAGQTMPVDGFFVIAGGTLVPNTDLVDANGPLTNWIQNGDPDAIILRRKSDSAVLDAVGYYTQYDTVPGTAENASLPASSYEGSGGTGVGGDETFNVQTGVAVSTARTTSQTFGRFPDGADTNNNVADFRNLYGGATPGAANSAIGSTPFTETFGAGGLTREWMRYFTDVIFNETAASSVPASIPNSPDSVSPANWASVKDNTGGGEQAVVIDYLAQDYYVEAAVYCGAISTVADGAEVGGLAGRLKTAQNNGTSDAWDYLDTAVGVYGMSQYALVCDYVGGTVQAKKVVNCVATNVGSAAPVSVGWHKLAMNFNGAVVEFFVDGSLIASLGSETPHAGLVAVGYRESSTGSTGQVRTNVDALKVEAAHAASIRDWSMY